MENLQRDFKGIWIPKDVWLDNRLNALDKIILMEIHSLDDADKGCYASNKYLAEFCQCTETKVSTTISKLKEFGYIELTNFDGRHRSLKIKSLSLKNLKSDIKNFKPNNINSKIDNNKLLNNKLFNNEKIIETEKPKKQLSKKQQNAIEIQNILNEFIKDENPELQQALKDYIDIRKTKGLQANQLRLILDNFEKHYSTKPLAIVLEQVKRATARGWLELCYEDNFNGKPKTSYGSKSNFDNTADTHKYTENNLDDYEKMSFEEKVNYLSTKIDLAAMTAEQREFFNTYCLAIKDENGNYTLYRQEDGTICKSNLENQNIIKRRTSYMED